MIRLVRRLGLIGMVLAFGVSVAQAQHQGDIWVGRTATGQLKIDPQGFIPAENYHTMNAVNGPFLWGWSDNDPGFDHVTADDPNNDVYVLESGAKLWLEVVSIDEAFQMIDNAFNFLNMPGQETYLGDHTLHVHNTWHIDSTDPAYDPDQCVWHATFILRDKGSTGYAASAPFTFNGFTNVTLQDLDGDFDDDLDVDGDDFAAFTECMDGAGAIPNPGDPAITTCEVACLNAFDFDDDRDVDVVDFAEFQVVFSGS